MPEDCKDGVAIMIKTIKAKMTTTTFMVELKALMTSLFY